MTPHAPLPFLLNLASPVRRALDGQSPDSPA